MRTVTTADGGTYKLDFAVRVRGWVYERVG